tara:strand:- start:1926 stop:6224 length:4299 start_codon:yes stop_codon:yes gene_type:complete
MISHIKKQNTNQEIYNVLNPIVGAWFKNKFQSFSPPQKYAILPIHNRENVLVSATTGSGKCLTPETTVLMNLNGESKLVSGEEIIQLAKSKGKHISNFDKSGEIYKVDGLKSYTLDDNKIKKKDALVYFEKYSGNLYNIKTTSGREVRLTPDHPLYVENTNGKGEWIQARNLKKGDRIAVINELSLPEREIKLNYKKALRVVKSKVKLFITYDDFKNIKSKTRNFKNFSKLNKEELWSVKAILRNSLEDLSKKSNIPPTTLYHLLNKKYKNSPHYATLYGIFNKELKKIKFEKNRIVAQTNFGKVFSFIYPKTLDKKLVRWTSFLLAEGLLNKYELGVHLEISQKNRTKLLEEIFRSTKELFDVEFKKNSYKDFSINYTPFAYFIKDLLDLDMGKGRNTRIPNWALNMKKDFKAGFLNVFFSLESHVSNKGNEITLSQANKQKIELINYLLTSFGIFTNLRKIKKYASNTKDKTVRDYYEISVKGIGNLSLFLEHIGIQHPHKKHVQNHIIKKSTGNHRGKHKLDYSMVKQFSRDYRSWKDYNKNLGSIREVVRRSGYVTKEALKNLMEEASKIKGKGQVQKELAQILESPIDWLEIKEIKEEKYQGEIFDLIVPDQHNFVGAFGGIVLHNTLTAFTAILNELITLSQKQQLEDKVYAIYISPLKALTNDVHFNLEEPLKEMEEQEKKKFKIRIGLRTGDTTPSQRQAMARKAPHILVTTSESLPIMLASPKFREKLRDVKYVIVDEIHSFAENKRGTHLTLSLEMLQSLNLEEITRIGLSATAEPIEEISQFLVGKDRPCKIAKINLDKKMDLKVLSPVPDLIRSSHKKTQQEMYKLVDHLIQTHKTTLVFTNTRSATERIVNHLKEKYPKKYTDNIGAHHGSLSKEHRLQMEKNMREGKLKAIVCSTSLELGIDIGFVDLVICLGSPKSIARTTQRIGRAGHKLHDTIKGRIIVLSRDDLVECSVLLKGVMERKVDKIHIPKNCLDVLAQQIFGLTTMGRTTLKEVYKLITSAYPYKDLKYEPYLEVINYLSGEYVTLEDRYVYAKIWYDPETGEMGKRGSLARVMYMTNIGTIPDETFISVKIKDQIVGHVDEAFLERLKRGDVFVLGGNKYTFLFARGMTAQVSATVDRNPTIPAWFSEMLPLSFDLAMEIQKFRRLLEDRFKNKTPKKEILQFINEYVYVDKYAAEAIHKYFQEQYLYSEIPHDKKMLMEFYSDENKKYVIFHSLYGRRVNDVLSRAIAYAIARLQHKDVEIGVNDNGFYIASEKELQAKKAFSLVKSHEIRDVMKNALDKTEVLKRRFRHCAVRSLMILRQYKGKKKKVGRQQVSSMLLINAVKRISEDFSILQEARREVLEDLMDIDNAIKILTEIEQGKIKVKEIHTSLPTPFSFNIVLESHTDFMKMEERTEYLQRMHNMVMAKIGQKHQIEA